MKGCGFGVEGGSGSSGSPSVFADTFQYGGGGVDEPLVAPMRSKGPLTYDIIDQWGGRSGLTHFWLISLLVFG